MFLSGAWLILGTQGMGLSELSFGSGGGVQDLQPGLYLVYKGRANPGDRAGGAGERLVDDHPRVPRPRSLQGHLGWSDSPGLP